MSTSRSKAVALAFSSNDPSQTPDSRALLCEIHVNLDAPDIVTVDVAQSGIRDEAEVLFDLGTVFRVIEIEYHSQDSTALCVLEATSDKPVFMRRTRKNKTRDGFGKFKLLANEQVRSKNTMRHTEEQLTESDPPSSKGPWKLIWASRQIEWVAIMHIEFIVDWQQGAIH